LISRSETYRRRADECLAQADATPNATTKRTFLQLATQWVALADRLVDEEAGRSGDVAS